MTITALPTPPPTSTDPTSFDTRADALVLALPTMVTEINVALASMNTIAAGGGSSIPYTFSTTITDSDPGSGFLRLDNAVQNLSSTIRADLIGADAATWTDVLDSFSLSTSLIKGSIKLIKITDATKWMVFNIYSIASPSGYRNISVTIVSSSSASPFINNDSLILEFTRNGDIGIGVQLYNYQNLGGF